MNGCSSLQRGPIEKEAYYHGFLPREDVKTVLRSNGEFLIRISEPRKGEARSHILSVMHNVPPTVEEDLWVKHFVIKSQDNKVFIEKNAFPSIQEMVDYHLKTKDSIRDDVCLLKALPRQSWELDHENIEIVRKLGEGAFGEVMMGKLKFRKGGKTVNVAIKQAKLSNMTKDQIKEFMGEARVMRNLCHPHVVRFYGVAATTEPLYMVMELATSGALDSFLKKNPDLPIEKKNEMILQAAWGLEYMHSKPVMHRDIAARNCLYGDGRVKISDFGLTRSGITYQADPNKKAPIRWLSTEIIRQRLFSLKSDVWAYAVMSWEIYNNGIEPYPGMMVAEVAQRVIQGYRMELPAELHPEIRALIGRCWAENDFERPTMAEVAVELQRITGASRPDFASLEAQLKKELLMMNNMTHKSMARKNKGKARLPKGM
uniref:Tyrosine-protein kinase n=2 Tax=Caenorhabditis tropicalis TaxID=1561998 RepID=A0A1I7TQY8_9PELO